jgi:hypothetical protein
MINNPPRRRRHPCGDIELDTYLTTDQVSLVLDLFLNHDRFGGGDDPNLNVHYIILMILIGHYMRLPLTKLENITLSIIRFIIRGKSRTKDNVYKWVSV